MSDNCMPTSDALRLVAEKIECIKPKQIKDIAWCIATLENAASQMDSISDEIYELRKQLSASQCGEKEAQMNADEIVRALYLCAAGGQTERQTAEWCTKAADLIESLQAQPEITGETSDGYHTFNELYHHRATLFSVICNSRPELAWKSKLHHDGTMYDGMFIVGIETPDGQATYHYDIEPYWEMFDVQELPKAPEWDGHTPTQAIERIGKLNPQPENKPLTRCENCARWDKSITFMGAHACAHWSPSRKEPRYTEWFEFCSFAEAKHEREEYHEAD